MKKLKSGSMLAIKWIWNEVKEYKKQMDNVGAVLIILIGVALLIAGGILQGAINIGF